MTEAKPTSSRVDGLLLLTPLTRYGDAALLVLRLLVGSFLVWGVADNLFSAERMREFAGFLDGFGFPAPQVMAPLSVWAQFLAGTAFIFGVLTRWAGIVCAINFLVAIVMVDAAGGIRAAFPATSLVVIGLTLATIGAGRFSIDGILRRTNQGARKPAGHHP